jgi:hypothetical protein
MMDISPGKDMDSPLFARADTPRLLCEKTEKSGDRQKKTGTGILFAAHPTYQLREEKKEGTAKK